MTTSRPLDPLPLQVRVFHAAMQRQLSLDDYATALDVAGDALRALLTAQAGQLAPETVARLAAAHGQSAEAGYAGLAEAAAVEPFSVWLNRHMEGVSQTSLRARTQLAGPQLRAFLSGKALPDADQAERIARALYVDRAEMARIIVADMARRAGPPGRRPAAADTAAAAADGAPAAPSLATPDAPAPARARSHRRQPPGAADAPPATAAAPAIADEAAPAQAAPPATAAAPAAPDEAAPVQAAPPSGAPDVVEPAARRRRAPARAPAAPTAEAMPLPAAAPDGETALAQEEAAPARARRKARQPAAVAEPPAAAPLDLSPPEPAPAAPPAAPAPARATRSRAAPPAPAAASPAVSAAPVADKRAGKQPAAPGAPADGEKDAGGSRASAETPPNDQARAAGLQAAQPLSTAAEIRSVETTLQLSPDEVRLIRIWRRLHPHGQRATLQYIGSLLVEE